MPLLKIKKTPQIVFSTCLLTGNTAVVELDKNAQNIKEKIEND